MSHNRDEIQALTPERRKVEFAATLFHLADIFDPSCNGLVKTDETDLAMMCEGARALSAKSVEFFHATDPTSVVPIEIAAAVADRLPQDLRELRAEVAAALRPLVGDSLRELIWVKRNPSGSVKFYVAVAGDFYRSLEAAAARAGVSPEDALHGAILEHVGFPGGTGMPPYDPSYGSRRTIA